MRLAPFALALALLLPIVGATDLACVQDVEGEVAIATPSTTIYVLSDPCQPNCAFSIWLFEEKNGIPGAQYDFLGARPGVGPCYPPGTLSDRFLF